MTFAPLSPAMIEAYILSGEPMDKAGAYGIQVHPGMQHTYLYTRARTRIVSDQSRAGA